MFCLLLYYRFLTLMGMKGLDIIIIITAENRIQMMEET